MDRIIKLLVKYYPLFLSGLGGTLWLSVVTVFCGTLLGIVVALLRMGKSRILRSIAVAYIEVLRDTPVLLQLYLFWVGLPKLLGTDLSETTCIVIAMIINASAYISEIIRAGIGAVDIGQWEAARSIGLSEKNVMTKVILPQAIKNILPALCNEFISTIKGTSLASVFFVNELMTAQKTISSITFLPLQSLAIAGAIYFVICFTLSKLLAVFERRLKNSD